MPATKKDDTAKGLVEVQEKAVLPAAMLDGMEDASGDGFNDTTQDDYAIPYISVANALSKALKPASENYIDGLEQGDIYDGTAGKRWSTVGIVPIMRQRFFVEWDDRQFIARHDPEAALMDSTTKGPKGENILPNGNELIDTVYLYVMLLDVAGYYPAVISFSKSSIPLYKKLMSRARRLKMQGKNGPFTPPLYSHVYTLGTVESTSKKGDDYWTWKLVGDPTPVTDPELFHDAKGLFESINKGERQAATPGEDDVVADGADSI
jgi:hypothetical protein